MESDYRYYSRRAAEEQRRACHAITPQARERHRELANLFASKATGTAVPHVQRVHHKEPQLLQAE